MPDTGARFTDEQIAELEARLTAMYETAYTDVRDKYMVFVKKFLRDDKIYRQKLKDGEITKETYDAWLRGQVFQRTRWEAQLDDLAQTLTNTTQAAMDIINDAAPGVFAMNANYASYEIEKAGNVDMGFGLYDEDTVRRLARDNPNLLPPSKVNIPIEQQWNKTLINRQIGVGIIAGEGIMAIADRLQRAATMSRNQALTHARTAMTGAQNAGRIEGYHRAEKMGIKLEKEWLATLDGHTRRAHAALDGQHVPVDKPFKSLLGDIMYPGDPSANPSNVYNCRCTLVSRLLDYPSQNAKRRPNLQKLGDEEVQKPIRDMTYSEWEKWKNPFKNKSEDVIIYETDIDVPRSVGAKTTNPDIELPSGEIVHLTEGTRITKVQVIAGKGRERQIDEIDSLIKRWGGNPHEWQKKKGIGFVDYLDESYKAELHWYEEPNAGSHKWKVKPDADGNWFIED